MRCVKEILPPRVRLRWLLMTMRLSAISFAGTARTLVAVGTDSEASMFFAIAAAAPRSCLVSGSSFAAGAAAGSLAAAFGAGSTSGFAGAAFGAGAAAGFVGADCRAADSAFWTALADGSVAWPLVLAGAV